MQVDAADPAYYFHSYDLTAIFDPLLVHSPIN